MKGSIVVRNWKRGKRFSAVLWIGDGPTRRQKWKTFARRKDAEKFLANAVRDVHQGTYVDVRGIPVTDLLDRWLRLSLLKREKTREVKPSTAISYRSMIEKHLRPAFGDYRSDRLSYAHVEAWIQSLADQIGQGDISAKSVNNLLSLFRSILEWARHPARSYLAHDPMKGIKRLPVPRTEAEYLEPDEIEALLSAAESPDDVILHVALFTGVRRGELFSLRWDDIDWGSGRDGGRIWIRRAIYHGRVSTPKTKNSIRVIDVARRTLDELKRHRESAPPIGEGYIFRTPKGSPIDGDNWMHRRFIPTLQRAGLRHIGLHALRHTFASLLINNGESIKYVSRQLGHASIQITADTYGHLFKETSRAAMQRLEAVIPPQTGPSLEVVPRRKKLAS